MPTLQQKTRVDLFDEAYKELRIKLQIREAATAALRDAVGPTVVSPVLGGFEIVCRGILEYSDDNENSFLEAARRVASKFKR